jgi:hypothetical protein
MIILCALVMFCTKAIHAKSLSAQSSKLKKNISFHGHTISGKFQLPFESTTTIEDEKSLDDLIGVRKNFQDRIQVSQELR